MAKAPRVVPVPTPELKERKLYFDNNKVEDLMLKYRWTGCTNIYLRDKIMSNTEELIRQIIRAHNLHRIYPGQEESAFGDLFQTAWIQIEKTLYKYRARPHCAECYNCLRPKDSCLYEPAPFEYRILIPEDVIKLKLACSNPKCVNYKKIPDAILYRGESKIFNLWSQVARTVILAYIKKESRDTKNSDSYKVHLDTKHESESHAFDRFMDEARRICKYNENFISILQALEKIAGTDDRPYEGIIGKLVQNSNQSRAQVTNFLKLIRLRSDEFSDSPINERPKRHEPGTNSRIFYEDE